MWCFKWGRSNEQKSTKDKRNISAVPEPVANTNLLKKSMIRKQAEIEAVMIKDMKREVWEQIEK